MRSQPPPTCVGARLAAQPVAEWFAALASNAQRSGDMISAVHYINLTYLALDQSRASGVSVQDN